MQHCSSKQIEELCDLLSQELLLLTQKSQLAVPSHKNFFEAPIYNTRAFSRSSCEERTYAKQYKQLLYLLYNNACAFCDSTSSIELDHAFLPKSSGGTFALKQHNGRIFNNTIPLCESCNKKKSNRPYEQVVPPHRRDYIQKINNIMNDFLNQHLTKG